MRRTRESMQRTWIHRMIVVLIREREDWRIGPGLSGGLNGSTQHSVELNSQS
jgi:hypothetical protein